MPHEEDPHGLQHQREWLRVTLTSIGDAVITSDIEGCVTFVNPVAERLTGWTDAECRGRPLTDVFRVMNEETRQPAENPVTRALREGVVVGLANHTVLIARDGTEFPIDDSAAPIRDDANRISGVVLVFRDVSGRRRAEQALRDSEEHFRQLVEGVTDYAIFRLDPGGHVASWNAGAERIKGWKADEIIGRHFSTFYPQEARDAGWPETELRVATAAGRFEDEGWRVRKDGTRFWANVIITALRGKTGELSGFSKITRDLTERRRAEAALRDSEARYRRLFEAAHDGVLLVDPADGKIIEANPAAGALLGRPREKLAGERLADIGLFPDPAACEAALVRMRTEGQVMHQDAVIVRPDGGHTELEVVLTSYLDARTAVQCTIRDIHERRQLERTMLQAEAMVDLNRRKDEFLAMLSHEMRNPLAPILNAVHLLRPHADETSAEQDARRIISRQVDRLVHLVDDLLEVSRITSGQFHVQRELLDARVLAERAREAVLGLITERKHELRMTLSPDPVWVRVDEGRMEQVLVNLLTNAAKYTDPGGQITLTVDPVAGEAVIRVEDTGVGISAELLPRVFDLFTQSERSLDRSEGGLGVGLTVVQRVVELHGGHVGADSPGPGLGSTFTVRLPLAPAPAHPQAESGAESPQPTKPLRVLVVDDNADVADSAALMLRHNGHTVRTEYSGAAVHEAVLGFRPDVVLLDLGLPVLDGYQVAQALKRDPHTASVRLVAVSGYGREGDLARSREAGFDAHLVKPVNPRHIEEVLAAIMTAHANGR